jgi:hypothetical protein
MSFIWKAAVLLFVSWLVIGPWALALVAAYAVLAFTYTFILPNG